MSRLAIPVVDVDRLEAVDKGDTSQVPIAEHPSEAFEADVPGGWDALLSFLYSVVSATRTIRGGSFFRYLASVGVEPVSVDHEDHRSGHEAILFVLLSSSLKMKRNCQLIRPEL